MPIKIDPEFEALIPPLTADEFSALESEIQAHGCRVPLDVWSGTLVDGHNRFKICTGHGIPFETKAINFESRDEAKLWIIRNQFARRNLDTLTRCELAAQYEGIEAAAAKERYDANVGRPKKSEEIFPQISERVPQTRDVLGSLAGVSGKTYEKAKTIIESGTPELRQAVKENRVSISAAAEIAALPPEEQKQLAAEENPRKAHVANNGGNNEWYTPPVFIEAARRAMGGIDCDPASSDIANKIVQADTYHTAETNGLERSWYGRVWMNPPYATPLIGQFAQAVAEKYTTEEIEQACILVNNATETEWFKAMSTVAAAVCFPVGRVRFIDVNGNASAAPLQGQAIIYMGENVEEFTKEFSQFGRVWT